MLWHGFEAQKLGLGLECAHDSTVSLYSREREFLERMRSPKCDTQFYFAFNVAVLSEHLTEVCWTVISASTVLHSQSWMEPS